MVYEKKVLTYRGKVVFEKIRMSKFRRIPKLYSENEACFMFLESGAFSVRSQDALVRFDQENALLAKCFNYFFELDQQQWEDTTEMELIGVIFYPKLIEEIFQLDLAQVEVKKDYNIQKIKVDPLLQNFKESIDYLLDQPSLADDTLIILKLREFIQLLLRQIDTISILNFFASLFNPVQYDLKTAVENNLYANLSIEELASLCNMSSSTFKRKFKSIYQNSPRAYILQQKIKKACHLLSFSSSSITQIAFDCGFESISGFNRNFKKLQNLSPSEFRKHKNSR